jgi:hypothetical protein
VLGADRDTDRCTVGRVLRGVIDEIREDLIETRRVGHDRRWCAFDRQLDGVLADGDAQPIDDRGDGFGEHGRDRRDLELAGVDSRRIQQLTDELVEATAIGHQPIEHRGRQARRAILHPLAQRLETELERCDRVAEVVRGDRVELLVHAIDLVLRAAQPLVPAPEQQAKRTEHEWGRQCHVRIRDALLTKLLAKRDVVLLAQDHVSEREKSERSTDSEERSKNGVRAACRSMAFGHDDSAVSGRRATSTGHGE